jgi:hypothetical protein
MNYCDGKFARPFRHFGKDLHVRRQPRGSFERLKSPASAGYEGSFQSTSFK